MKKDRASPEAITTVETRMEILIGIKIFTKLSNQLELRSAVEQALNKCPTLPCLSRIKLTWSIRFTT
jgi:hypothetical protein